MTDFSKNTKNSRKIEAMEGYNDRLKFAMFETGWKQIYLAKEVGLTQPRISQLLKGIRYPRIPVSQKIAFTLGVPYRWLAYGEGGFEIYEYDYPMEDFWTTVQDRICYLLWTNGTRQLDFDEEFISGEIWINEARTIAEHWFPLLDKKFDCPKGFICRGFAPDASNLDFFLREFSNGLRF